MLEAPGMLEAPDILEAPGMLEAPCKFPGEVEGFWFISDKLNSWSFMSLKLEPSGKPKIDNILIVSNCTVSCFKGGGEFCNFRLLRDS